MAHGIALAKPESRQTQDDSLLGPPLASRATTVGRSRMWAVDLGASLHREIESRKVQ
jgi:hypothetical protein